jgi:hypothetical protein
MLSFLIRIIDSKIFHSNPAGIANLLGNPIKEVPRLAANQLPVEIAPAMVIMVKTRKNSKIFVLSL